MNYPDYPGRDVLNPPYSNETTSKAAADAIKPKAPSDRSRVLAYVRANPRGVTDHEIQDALGMTGDTERPRRWELVNATLIYDSTMTKPGRTGKGQCVVWKPTTGRDET